MCLNPALSTIVTLDESLLFDALVLQVNIAFCSTVRFCSPTKNFIAGRGMISFSTLFCHRQEPFLMQGIISEFAEDPQVLAAFLS